MVYEGSCVHPELLQLMVEHPLEPGDRYSLYDDVGRPTAWFTGELESVPAMMPISEELDWPEHLGPADIVRLVYEEDRERAEDLVLRSEGATSRANSLWQRKVDMPTLRWLADSPRPLAQIEIVALGVALSSGAWALLDSHLGLILSALCLLAGVHVAALLRAARLLRERGSRPLDATLMHATHGVELPGEGVARATRPLAHAAALAGLTYVLVDEADRSSVAGLIVLAAGAGAVLLSLGRARKDLRATTKVDAFALPDTHALARRLGLRLPAFLAGAPLLELTVLLAALPGLMA